MEGYPGLFEDRLEYQLQDIRKIATLHQNWILKKVNDLQIVVERSLQESQFPTPFFLSLFIQSITCIKQGSTASARSALHSDHCLTSILRYASVWTCLLPHFHSLSSSLLCMTQDESSLSSRSTSSLLSELQTALRALDLASARVNTVSAALSRRHLWPLSQSPPHVSLVPPPPPPPVIDILFPVPALPPLPARTPLLRGGYICSGDLVEIINPRANFSIGI